MTELLSDRERAILEFEARRPGHSSAKEEAIRGELELAPARYYQLLDRVIDSEQALVADPMLVRRLRRIRDDAAARRADRTALSAG
ncbi:MULTISPECIES: DUF3263 domain-containing protein [unclassified Microbacterium]|uniref:DUF3263 domain-containing protein n=1 Tax=unclassified Microbacterium TaxID=2609290 RepID=UPI001AC9A486|nr:MULTISPECIES: DUF3263 domain-containing protein [unclassified Microbacterium]MBN9157453.1 DUF3263 domain-containing protein [Microbacterium sp.]MBS1897107.1 DUF3263 domain-containing protein [Actinomycetota bacterium]MBS1902027.1 DUF3263 domain-containing protein [Actinomycetota bacterium]